MHASASILTRAARPSILLVLVLAALSATLMGERVRAADASAVPPVSASPIASEPAKTMCESAADLRLYVGFLRDQSLDEDGLVPILVGAAASLSEAHTLAGLVSDTYRPLVDDLVSALSDLVWAVRGFREQGTIGAGLVGLGDAITRVGTAMDALSGALREPCPIASPGPSTVPAASGSPAA
jgi:hypothetical protein